MSKRAEDGTTQIPVRIPNALRSAIEKDAEKSGWTLSEQIRYELMAIRGMWKQPYLPTQGAPGKS